VIHHWCGIYVIDILPWISASDRKMRGRNSDQSKKYRCDDSSVSIGDISVSTDHLSSDEGDWLKLSCCIFV